MAYTVFVSHSVSDQAILLKLAKHLEAERIELYVAEWDVTPGRSIGAKTRACIDRADCMVVLLTREGSRSEWVNQEIGYAIRASKPVLPFVESGTKLTGLLEGVETISFDGSDPGSFHTAMESLGDYITKLQAGKKRGQRALWIVGGLLLLAALFGRDEDEY